jgi:geranylgeranylglycerol-phosphate geranylgeranyltransferase
MNSYLELLRPYNGILAVLGIIIGSIVAGSFAAINTVVIVLAAVVSFLVNGAGNAINDYFDYKIDQVNRPKRPIPSGRVKRNSVAVYFILLIAVSLVLSYYVSVNFFYIALINSVVSLVYSWKLKGTPLIGNIAVSWLAASTFIAAALISYTFQSVPMAVMILASMAFLGSLGREIVKDVEDVKGDKEFSAKTLAVVAGEKPAKIIAAIVIILGILSLLVPIYIGLFSVFYYLGMVPAVLICLAAIMSMKNSHKSQKLMKFAMYFVFLGFILGAVL